LRILYLLPAIHTRLGPKPTAKDDVDIADRDESEEEQEVKEELLIDQSGIPMR
jgi:hypothetical protein